ncbi:integral membrane protein [Herbihabitans rhizosphaerae]|uniref:Integral membrane protein n=1 Tax=Herbihabitans rhizosphaerae TaxID=1872711 RepID=A0A4Q7KQB3_9PSEU|nr:DUF3817 domain-containing protein [Herbihabitans rhizosphaerae]RZS38999.1 integral membrane protein [Herbihabitans rhizosphaerae]
MVTPTWFRVAALAEALSWLGLLIGMYFKYATDSGDLGVKVFGPIHGVIFVGYVLATLGVRPLLKWDRRTTILALGASIPPLATVVFERWAARTGRLEEPATSR